MIILIYQKFWCKFWPIPKCPSDTSWHSQNGLCKNGHSNLRLPTNTAQHQKKSRKNHLSPRKPSKKPSKTPKKTSQNRIFCGILFPQALLNPLGVRTEEAGGTPPVRGDVAATHGDPQTCGFSHWSGGKSHWKPLDHWYYHGYPLVN